MKTPSPPKIQTRAKPNGIVKLSKKGIGIAFGLASLFGVMLAYGVNQNKSPMQSAENSTINSAMDSNISDKLGAIPDIMLTKKEEPTVINEGDTIINGYPPSNNTLQQLEPVEKKGPSLRDIMAQQRLLAFESAISSNSNALVAANTPDINRITPSRGTSNAGLTSNNIAEILNSPDQDQNLQPRKEIFLQSANIEYPTGYLGSTRKHPISPYEIKQGAVIPAVMVGGLNSDLPGFIKAMVTEDIYDTATGELLLVPKGSQLVGVYDSRVAFGQERALVVWRRLIFPDASALDLENMPGMDEGGFSGMFDRVDNHYLKVFGAGIVLSLFQASYEITASNNNDGRVSNGDTAAEAVSKQITQIGSEYARRGLNIQPTIEIRNGVQFNVFVHKDIVFNEAYEHRFINVAEYEANRIDY